MTQSRTLKAVTVSVLLAAIVGCTHTQTQTQSNSMERPQAVPEHADTSDWYCARLPISTSAERDSLTLFVRDQEIEMLAVESASGAKYQAENNGNTVFWNQGREAKLTLDGQEVPTCLLQGTLAADFSAQGNEPFWRIAFDRGSLSYRTPSTDSVSSFVLEQPHRFQHKLQANTPDGQLNVNITKRVCHDSMTGLPFPYEVEGQIGSQQVSGCGGDTLRLLQGAEWHINQINGENLGSVIATLTFLPDGRVAGQTGCNRFFGEYKIGGESVEISSVGMTRRACPPNVAEVEQQYMSQLSQTVSIEFDSVGALVLKGRSGSVRAFAL